MADAINTPQTITLTNTVSPAALSTAIATQVNTLLIATGVKTNSIVIHPMTTYTAASTLTFSQTITYNQFIVPTSS